MKLTKDFILAQYKHYSKEYDRLAKSNIMEDLEKLSLDSFTTRLQDYKAELDEAGIPMTRNAGKEIAQGYTMFSEKQKNRMRKNIALNIDEIVKTPGYLEGVKAGRIEAVVYNPNGTVNLEWINRNYFEVQQWSGLWLIHFGPDT